MGMGFSPACQEKPLDVLLFQEGVLLMDTREERSLLFRRLFRFILLERQVEECPLRTRD